MAAGMHAAASGQLGTLFAPPSTEGPSTVPQSAPPSVEIVVLSEEQSQEAKAILQERSRASRPSVAKYGEMLHCSENTADGSRVNRRLAREMQSGSFVKRITDGMPILGLIPTMSWITLRADLIAGLTVGVMVIPQSMSYASIAGLPYIYGMYAACVPTFVYAFLGQSRQLAVGPVAMVSLLIEAGLTGMLSEEECPASYKNGKLDSSVHQYEECPEQYVRLAILTAAVVGVLQIVGRLLKMGFLVSFLGHPVTSGFTSGAAIIIGTSQLKYILGFSIAKSEFFYITVWNIIKDIHQTKWMTVLLGLSWLAFLMTLKRLARRGGKLAMISPLGPLISCVAGSLLVFACAPLRDDFHVKYVGEIPSGLFPMSVHHWDLGSVFKVMPTALSVCLIGYMESIAIGKNLAAKHGHEIEAGQELFALGVSNLVGAMFSCYPVTGSFSRSAVANATGGLTQVAGIITSIVMLCTLMFLTPLFKFLPHFVLAAIVISSVIPLVAYSEAMKLWRIKKADFFLWIVAFLGTLILGVLMGIALAVVLSLMIVIYESVRPQITILWRIPGTTIYRNMKQESSGGFIPNVFIARIGSSMYFANASFIKDMLLAYVEDLQEINATEYIVLEMTPVVSVDSTAIHVIQDIVHDFRSRGIQIAFAMVGNRVEKVLRKAQVTEFIGEQWFFPTVNQAVVACLQHQQDKKLKLKREVTNVGSEHNSEDLSMAEENPNVQMVLGNEVGFSNDLHHACTTLFINLVKDLPMIVSGFTACFEKNHLMVRRAQIEVLGDGEDDPVRHTYLLRSSRHAGKLLDWELASLREELQEVIRLHKNGQVSVPAQGMDGPRIRALEVALAREKDYNLRIQERLEAQNARMSSIRDQDGNCRAFLEGEQRDNDLAQASTEAGPRRGTQTDGVGNGTATVDALQQMTENHCFVSV